MPETYWIIEQQEYLASGDVLNAWHDYGCGRFEEEKARRLIASYREMEARLREIYGVVHTRGDFRLVKITREVIEEGS